MTAASTTLQPLPESVPLARGFVRGALKALGAAGACDDAETLVAELATNAVLHAHTEFTIDVTRNGPTVRVRVRDLSAVLPRRRDYDLDATTGRGMRLIESLSTGWGVEAGGGGKAVWFDLPAEGNLLFVPAWDDAEIDVDALLAAFDDPDDPGAPDEGAPPAASLAATWLAAA